VSVFKRRLLRDTKGAQTMKRGTAGKSAETNEIAGEEKTAKVKIGGGDPSILLGEGSVV